MGEIKSIIVGVVTACVVGAGTSYVTIKTSLVVMEKDISAMSNHVQTVNTALGGINDNANKIYAHSVALKSLTERVSELKGDVKENTKNITMLNFYYGVDNYEQQ